MGLLASESLSVLQDYNFIAIICFLLVVWEGEHVHKLYCILYTMHTRDHQEMINFVGGYFKGPIAICFLSSKMQFQGP